MEFEMSEGLDRGETIMNGSDLPDGTPADLDTMQPAGETLTIGGVPLGTPVD